MLNTWLPRLKNQPCSSLLNLPRYIHRVPPSNGSVIPVEKNEVYEAEELSGVPPEVTARQVRIYRPCRNPMQSGQQPSAWKIDFNSTKKWENPLMGWTSSADPVQALQIASFKTKADAVLFAERQGYPYWIDEPKTPKFKKKTYADNFTFSPAKLKIIRTK